MNVLVLDETGDLLNVNTSPQQIKVTIPVQGTEQTVPMNLEEIGTPNEDYEYALEFAQGEPEQITLIGESGILEEMNDFSVEVDVSGITESTIRTIPIPLPDGISDSNPRDVDVLIRVTPVEQEAEDDEDDTV